MFRSGEGNLRRPLALTVASASAVFACYASLVPFGADRVTWEAIAQNLHRVEFVPVDGPSVTDFVSNVLLFMPIGLSLAAGLLKQNRSFSERSHSLIVILALCMGLSVAIELIQTLLPTRTPSLSDVAAETAGALLGTAVWIMFGRDVTAAFVRLENDQPRTTGYLVALAAYFGIVALAQWSPLDFTLRPAEIFEKYRAGRLSLSPYPTSIVWNLLLFGACLPLGWLSAMMWLSWKPPRIGFAKQLATALLLVGCIEVGQILVGSRHAELSHAWASCLGASIGVMAARSRAARTLEKTERRSATGSGR